ncbi:hypothetical protein HNQ42_003076 [Rummeliibacillus stabekisii]|nr:hypothetical protein [Rummeliibacillus stabekisii]
MKKKNKELLNLILTVVVQILRIIIDLIKNSQW